MTKPLEFIERTTGPEPTHAIIWLHGLGADGHDFEPIVPELDLPEKPAIRFIFPHAPKQSVTINAGMVMRAWYDISGLDFIGHEDQTGIRRSSEMVRRLIEHENTRGIPGNRIILAGFSQGGAIALHLGLRHTESLAGILALSTYLPLARYTASEVHEANRKTPIFMAHGNFDPVVPFMLGDTSHQQLQAMGYDVEWHTYPIPHSVSLDEIRDISTWLKSRIVD